ncbi:MAG: hypothetical protein IIW91_06535, partial [Alistipes sp.]|nr:hypothetical protein [Alistipes sp.]
PKKWRKNRAVTIFGVIRENFLKRMRSHFYFVKRSPFFYANFLVCPFFEKLPAAFASDRWSDLRLFPCVSNSALRKFVDKGRRAGGGLKNDDLLIASKVRSNHFTDDKRRPHKFRLAAHLGSTFWVTKGGCIF